MESFKKIPSWPRLPKVDNWEHLIGGEKCRQGKFFRWFDWEGEDSVKMLRYQDIRNVWESPDCKAEILYIARLGKDGWLERFVVDGLGQDFDTFFDTFEEAEEAIFNNPELNSRNDWFWADSYFKTEAQERAEYLGLETEIKANYHEWFVESDLRIVKNMVHTAFRSNWFQGEDEDFNPVKNPAEMTDAEMVKFILDGTQYLSDPAACEAKWVMHPGKYGRDASKISLPSSDLDYGLHRKFIGERLFNLDPSGAVDYYKELLKESGLTWAPYGGLR